MSEKKQTIFVTKYALTGGPFAVEAEIHGDGKSAFWLVSGCLNSVYGNEWHTTKEAALADCERRRKTKLASIENQRQKLEMMEFKL